MNAILAPDVLSGAAVRIVLMPRVAIVTDSSACLPPELVEQYHIIVVPLAFLFDGELSHDGELSSHEFYERLKVARRFPSTTSPAPGEFLDAFRRAREEGAGSVLCLTLSAAYSGTHSAAVSAAELAGQELTDVEVRVVDTGGIAMSHGFAVLAAARAVESRATLDEATNAAQTIGSRAELVGALDTMRYLAKGGRVPWIAHWAASLLRVKPILVARGERVGGVGRARTMRGASDQLLRHLEGRDRLGCDLHVAVMHADAPERARELALRVQERISPAELIVTEFTSVMGIHTGPGFLGLAFYSSEPLPQSAPILPWKDGRSNQLERDVRALEVAVGELPQPGERPALIVLSGLPASGKSHLSRELRRRRPLALLESDALRKALFKKPKYTQSESARLFAACHVLLERLLARGVSVVLDATNLKEIHRRPLYRIAEEQGARLVLVQVKAPPAVIRGRLDARSFQGRSGNPWDQSEAGHDVYEKMREEAEPLQREHLVVDTSVEIGRAVEKILRELRQVKT